MRLSSQSRQPARFHDEGVSEPSWRYRHMHHSLVSEDPSHVRAREGKKNRNRVLNRGLKPGPLSLTAIRGLQHQTRGMGSHPVAGFLESRDGLSRPPGETQKIADPPDQRCFQHDRKIGGQQDRATRGTGDGPNHVTAFRPTAFYHISRRTQPYSPAWQLPGQVRDQGTIGTDDKPEHFLLGKTIACHHATAQGSCFRLLLIRVNNHAVMVRAPERNMIQRNMVRQGTIINPLILFSRTILRSPLVRDSGGQIARRHILRRSRRITARAGVVPGMLARISRDQSPERKQVPL